MNYIAECLEKFQSLTKALKEDLGSGQAYLALNAIEKEFSLNLSFVLILLAIDELEENDLPEYLKAKFKLNSKQAQVLTEQLFDKVYDPAIERQLNFKVENGSINKEPKYKAFEISSVFEGNLINFINLPPEDVRQFNISVFVAINADPLLEDRLINSLYSNKEIVSKINIIYDGDELRPTVSNWIKDFFVNGGDGLFDGLILAKYLSSSINASKLSESEKMLLSKVLKTYRNLVFFPESMENVPIELWELLPVENDNGIKDVLVDDDNFGLSTPGLSESIVTEVEATSEIDNSDNSQSSKLLAALNNYPPASLEHKVIKQELDRLRQLTNKSN